MTHRQFVKLRSAGETSLRFDDVEAIIGTPPESSFLPRTPPPDPADRIVSATARAFGYRLMTRDRSLLDYGQSGRIDVIAC